MSGSNVGRSFGCVDARDRGVRSRVGSEAIDKLGWIATRPPARRQAAAAAIVSMVAGRDVRRSARDSHEISFERASRLFPSTDSPGTAGIG